MFPTSEDITFKNAEWKPVIADTWFFVRHLSKIIASFISGDKIGQNLGISSRTLSLLAGERVDITSDPRIPYGFDKKKGQHQWKDLNMRSFLLTRHYGP